MPAFRPVSAHQPCRFSLSFGEVDRGTGLLQKDVPDRLLNRVAVNAAVVALGKKSIAELDALAHAAVLATAPRNATREPDNFWKRTASGTPRLRLDGKEGVSQQKLARKLPFLSSGEAAIERVRRWPLWALIHPDPVDAQCLLDLEELIADLVTSKAWFETTDRSVTPVDQVNRIVQLVEADQLELSLNAHWLSLRRASNEADLPRYAHLYRAWLMLRPRFEQHPLFRLAAPLLYEFTAFWFGQVEILADRFLRPMSDGRRRYFEFVESTLASLRDATSKPAEPFESFQIGASTQHPGLRVRPKFNLAEHYFNGEWLRDTPIAEFHEAWPIVMLKIGGESAPRDDRPGLRSRPKGWRARYAKGRPLVIDSYRRLSAEQLGDALGGVSGADVHAMERTGKLFTVTDGSITGFPSFQADPEIRGEPLTKVLEQLAAQWITGTSIWNFFTSKSPMLANLSPVELLTRKASRRDLADFNAQRLLASSHSSRSMAVLDAARQYRVTFERDVKFMAAPETEARIDGCARIGRNSGRR